jgi:hypothetical protein
MGRSKAGMSRKFYQLVQKRVAETTIGASSLRHQGNSGVVKAARKYLRELIIRDFVTTNPDNFQRVLNKRTEELRLSLPKGAQNWGTARKSLNLFLREALYNHYLSDHLNLTAIEHWLELPLDKYVAAGVREYDQSLPKWRSIKGLTKEESDKYQAAAQEIANEKGLQEFISTCGIGVPMISRSGAKTGCLTTASSGGREASLV